MLSAMKRRGADTITVQWDRADKPVVYKFCPSDQLKPDARFFRKQDRKALRQLPIKPGYYRAFDSETNKPITCNDTAVCSYFLFAPTRYALRATQYGTSGKLAGYANTVKTFVSAAQVGPRAYETKIAGGGDGDWDDAFLIEAPDRFRSWNGELGVWKFVPVDPKTIPASQMPHF